MRNYEAFIEQRFVVPNTPLQIVITQRRDPAFRESAPLSEDGYYYVAAEESDGGGNWNHVRGSTRGGFRGYDAAYRQAETLWNELNARSIK